MRFSVGVITPRDSAPRGEHSQVTVRYGFGNRQIHGMHISAPVPPCADNLRFTFTQQFYLIYAEEFNDVELSELPRRACASALYATQAMNLIRS
jgi:hypothetical protein